MAGIDNRFEYLLRICRGAFDNSQEIRSRGLEGAGLREFAGEGSRVRRVFASSHHYPIQGSINANPVIAATAWARYRACGGTRSRIAADFLIGAHAARRADRLLTRDTGFYRQHFLGLAVQAPSELGAL